jgi:hypothetical protein
MLLKWVELNTALRKECKNAGDLLGADHHKFILNSTYGKMCENLRIRKNLTFARSSKEILQLSSSLFFNSASFISNNLLKIMSYPEKIHLNRPVQIGVSIFFLKNYF